MGNSHEPGTFGLQTGSSRIAYSPFLSIWEASASARARAWAAGVGRAHPEVALGGNVVTGRDQEDPRLPDLAEDRLQRRVVALGRDGVHMAGDQ